MRDYRELTEADIKLAIARYVEDEHMESDGPVELKHGSSTAIRAVVPMKKKSPKKTRELSDMERAYPGR